MSFTSEGRRYRRSHRGRRTRCQARERALSKHPSSALSFVFCGALLLGDCRYREAALASAAYSRGIAPPPEEPERDIVDNSLKHTSAFEGVHSTLSAALP